MNPQCVTLKNEHLSVAQVLSANIAHPEWGLDGNGNGVPCDVTFPRARSSVQQNGLSGALKDPAPAAAPALPKITTSPSPTLTPAPSPPKHAAPAATVQVATTTATARPATTTSHTATPVVSATLGQRAVAQARTWIGTPYLYGGTTRSGVDCSGLVQNVFSALGVNLPRTSSAQADSEHVDQISRSQLQPGDLVFGVSGGVVHHVGIYIGNDQQIDAPQDGIPVGVHKLYSDQTRFGRVTS